MPITELKTDSLSQHCTACEHERQISFSELAVGVIRQDVVDPYMIALPVCAACGAREFLLRTPNPNALVGIRPGSYSHLHRLLVDRLHHLLIQAGRIAEGADRRVLKGLPRTDTELETWLPDGWRLPAMSR